MRIGLSWVEDGAILDQEIDCDSDRGKLALAVLKNDLETAPLAMLIDEIQTTREYAEQSKFHPRYEDMRNLLIEIGKRLGREISINDSLTFRILIGRLLAPCMACEATGYIKEQHVHDEQIVSKCKECTNGYKIDLFTGSTHA